MKKLTKIEQAARAAVVDRLGALNAEIAAIEPKVKEAKSLCETISGWAADLPAEQSAVFGGQKFTAICSERRNERTVDLKALRGEIGDKFFDIASVKLGDVDELVKQFPTVSRCISEDRTGKRSVKTHAQVA